MKFRSTLLLALLVAALGAWLWWVERPKVEREAEKKTLLAPFDRTRVAAVELVYPDASITLRRKDGRWRMESPVDVPADPGTVRNLLEAVAAAESKKVVADEAETPATYGLDVPTAQLTLVLDDATRLPTIRIGKTTPVGYGAYARVGDDPSVLLTTGAFHAGVRKSVDDLRDRTILAFRGSELKQVRIVANGRSELVLDRDGEGDGWKIVQPSELRADTSQVQGFLTSLEGLRAEGFADGAPTAEQGLLPPEQTITLVPREGDPLELRVGKVVGDENARKVFVARGATGPVYWITPQVAQGFGKGVDELRDKTIVSIPRDKVAAVVATRADGNGFRLEKKDGAWQLADAGGVAVRQALLDRFVEDARTLRGSEVAAEPEDVRALGLDRPTLSIAFEGEGATPLGRIRITRRDAAGVDQHVADADGGGVAWVLVEHVFQRIDRSRDAFLDRPTPTPAPTPVR
ncbi:MAG: DUF4340 domain-containing protein [Alphaproteobacteria bacterium]